MALAAVMGLNAQKLSPNAEALLMRQEARSNRLLSNFNSADTVPASVKVFINLNDPSALDRIRDLGGTVYTAYDDYATALLPVSVLREVSQLDDVKYVEMGAPVHLCLDQARKSTNVNMVHMGGSELPQAYFGTGVVIGIIDTGLQFGHIDFYDGDRVASRIKRVWNQNAIGKAPEKFGYGAEYTSFEQMVAARCDSEAEYHGSHVTGIAAGADFESGYYGVAPDADIVFVSFGNSTADIPNAVQYIMDYAESVGKPCVINMSLGSHSGPHDGTSALDKYFETAVGPGKILVGAAGNEGESNLHIHKKFTDTDTSLKTMLGFRSSANKNSLIDIWGNKGSKFTVTVAVVDALKGKIISQSEEVSSSDTESVMPVFTSSSTGVDAYFDIVPVVNPVNGAPNVYVEAYITALASNRQIGLIIKGEDGNEINMWNVAQNPFINGGLRGWEAGDTECSVGEIGGTSEAVISVGSYNSRYTFPLYSRPGELFSIPEYDGTVIPLNEISSFSSCGPTADGRTKPDVLAPGALVVSAINTFAYGTNIETAVQRTTVGKDNYYYDLNLGTSMASPVVAGTMALWLEAYPDMTPEMAKDAIKATSVADQYTGEVPNNRAGYGKLNAYEGLKYILKSTGVNTPVADKLAGTKVWVEKGARTICCVVAEPASVEIYSISGARMGTFEVGASFNSIDVSSWAHGVYLLRFSNDGYTAKVMI